MQRGFQVVRGAGLEPARYFYHEPLKLACLPVPPPALSCRQNDYLLVAGGAGKPGCGMVAGALDGGGNTGAPALPCGKLLRGIRPPSKILPVTRLVDEYAKMIEVAKKTIAQLQVTLVSRLPAPLAPKTVWLEPPNTAPTSAPLPCCSRTTVINVKQTMI